ncbi:unnamed protein product [Rangifer tarandus platyrhynchus]|uniref:Uncharacterized protein n=2 Tax=Rangifer tarandus platyrhynchus TaxID=3082113 RepID=A0AC59YVQ7_RANTA|nr:unnamed protein product [Rangifer tarandus platyrhynchus]
MLTPHPHMHTYTHNLDRHTLTHPCVHTHPDMPLSCAGVHTHTGLPPPRPDTQSHLPRFHCRRGSPDLQSPPQPASNAPGASTGKREAENGLGFTRPSPQAVCPALTGQAGPQRWLCSLEAAQPSQVSCLPKLTPHPQEAAGPPVGGTGLSEAQLHTVSVPTLGQKSHNTCHLQGEGHGTRGPGTSGEPRLTLPHP